MRIFLAVFIFSISLFATADSFGPATYTYVVNGISWTESNSGDAACALFEQAPGNGEVYGAFSASLMQCVNVNPELSGAYVTINNVVCSGGTYVGPLNSSQACHYTQSCPSGQSRDSSGTCITPPPICTPPQVLQGNVCVTPPPPVCVPPQILQNNVCVNPDPTACPPGYEKMPGGWCAAVIPDCSIGSPNYDPLKCDQPPCQFGQRRAADGLCYNPAGGGDGSGDAGGNGGGDNGGGGGGGDTPDPSHGGADGCPDGQVKVNGVCANQNPNGGCPTGTSRGTVNGVEGCYGSGGGGIPPDTTPPDTSKPGVDGCPAGQIKVNDTCVNQAPATGGCPSGSTRGTVNGVEACYITQPTGGSGNNNQTPPATGQCDPTKNNYAECIGQLEKPKENAVQSVTNDMEKIAGDSIKSYGDTITPKIQTGETIDMTGANNSTALFMNIIPQPASCDASILTFTMSGHVLQLDCSRFERLKVWFGWALWLMTVYACIFIATAKDPGV